MNYAFKYQEHLNALIPVSSQRGVNEPLEDLQKSLPELAKNPLLVDALIRTPTLVAACRHDFICSPIQAGVIHSSIQGSRLELFESSGHFPWLEEPDSFFDKVRIFASAQQLASSFALVAGKPSRVFPGARCFSLPPWRRSNRRKLAPAWVAARHHQRCAAAWQQARRADAGVTQGHGASPVR